MQKKYYKLIQNMKKLQIKFCFCKQTHHMLYVLKVQYWDRLVI